MLYYIQKQYYSVCTQDIKMELKTQIYKKKRLFSISA